jgi:hypothetical protein
MVYAFSISLKENPAYRNISFRVKGLKAGKMIMDPYDVLSFLTGQISRFVRALAGCQLKSRRQDAW